VFTVSLQKFYCLNIVRIVNKGIYQGDFMLKTT